MYSKNEKKTLRSWKKNFSSNEDVIKAVEAQFAELYKNFYLKGSLEAL